MESCSKLKLFLESDTYNTYWLELSNGITYGDIEQLKKKNLIFANDVEYKEGKYNLKDTISVSLNELNSEKNVKKILDGHHYFCKDFTVNCSNVNYILDYSFYDYDDYDYYDGFVYEIFTNGDTSNDIYNEFKSSTNENDSEIKKVIDKWYSENLIDDTKYLEDTIWCNDRSIIANIFNKEFDLTNLYNINNFKLSHTCSNINDMFTVSNKNGNGKLTYPVATITDREVAYAGSPAKYVNESEIKPIVKEGPTNYLSQYVYDSGRDFLTMTPYNSKSGKQYFSVSETRILQQPYNHCAPLSIKENSVMPIFDDGFNCDDSYVRPMISLKHSMIVSSGDGTQSEPYKVVEGDTAEVQYIVDGNAPNGFLPPEVESYLKGSKVKMNGLKAGDIINGYRFLGWYTEDVEVVDGAFDMPENKVVFVGKFEKIEDSPLTYDSIGKYLTTGIIGVVGLFGLILLKKKY